MSSEPKPVNGDREKQQEEAERLKALAVQKYAQSNIKSALKYARRAFRLSPSLSDLSSMLTTFKILLASSKSSASGPPDYYKILQLEPFSNINLIKKQYKKLALALHPDKNSFAGCEVAFKLVADASRVLSDRVKRKDYDKYLRNRIQEEEMEKGGEVGEEREGFWTVCTTCRVLHKFEKKYIGFNLVCPGCKKSFVAKEVDGENENRGDGEKERIVYVRKRKISGVGEVLKRANEKLKDETSERKSLEDVEEEQLTLAELQLLVKKKVAREKNTTVKSTAKDVADNMEAEEDKEKGKEQNDDVDEERIISFKKSVNLGNETRSAMKTRTALGKSSGLVTEEKEKSDEDEDYVEEDEEKEEEPEEEEREASVSSEDLGTEVTERMTTRSASRKGVGLVIEKEGRDVEIKRSSPKNRKEKRTGAATSKKSEHLAIVNQKKAEEDDCLRGLNKKILGRNENQGVSKSRYGELDFLKRGRWKRGDFEIMAVEESDFYDFDKDRTERSFKKGQVWAIYDDDDGMPRHYGLIDEVDSVNPFQVKMSWLDFQGNGDEGLITWDNSKMHASCGRFKVAKKTIISSVNFFSHVVNCERAAREVYRIFPKKGSVWALYKEDSMDIDRRNHSNKDKRLYDIVVSLTSYSDMHGLSMAYLEKVDGLKTVFKRSDIGCHAIKWVEKGDVQFFSHEIPARKLSQAEAQDLPKDCWELDPASLPSELFSICS